MDKKHLPFNILLGIMILSVSLAFISSLFLRQSSFAVSVGYAIPQPAPPPEPTPPRPVSAQTESEPQESAIADDEPQSDIISSVQFPLELNRATYGQLLFIPGVGDVTAQRIIQYRAHLGGYDRLDQLLDIQGIGEGTYQRFAPYLYLEDEIAPQDPPDEEDFDPDEEDDNHQADDYYDDDDWEE